MRNFFFLLLFFLVGCEGFLKFLGEPEYDAQLPSVGNEFSLFFSHNINGETHPCGCRHFPLGGLPQIAGAMFEVSSQTSSLYVDTGDLFFPSTSVPDTVKESHRFIAEQLAIAMKKLKLTYFVPGDQDYALGEDFLIKLLDQAQTQALVANFSQKSKIPAKKWARVKMGQRDLFFVGIINPAVFPSHLHQLFVDPMKTLDVVMSEIESLKDQDSLVIILSHGGMSFDEQIAEKFPLAQWIIGAHSQSFTQQPNEHHQSLLVQVLSRNHYLGHLKFGLSPQTKTVYQTIEVRDSKKDKISPNPFAFFLEDHKSALEEIQKKEQAKFAPPPSIEKTLATSSYCLECHKPQSEKWMSTAHAHAW